MTIEIKTGDAELDAKIAELSVAQRMVLQKFVDSLRVYMQNGGIFALIALATVGTEYSGAIKGEEAPREGEGG